MLILVPILFVAQSTTNVQTELKAMYQKWDKAVVAHDKKTMESILAPKFAAKVKGTTKKLNKKEFINGITAGWSKKDSPKEQSFTTKINKVMELNSGYAAYIDESITFKLKDGSTRKVAFKSLDTWMRVGKSWQIFATEPMDK